MLHPAQAGLNIVFTPDAFKPVTFIGALPAPINEFGGRDALATPPGMMTYGFSHAMSSVALKSAKNRMWMEKEPGRAASGMLCGGSPLPGKRSQFDRCVFCSNAAKALDSSLPCGWLIGKFGICQASVLWRNYFQYKWTHPNGYPYGIMRWCKLFNKQSTLTYKTLHFKLASLTNRFGKKRNICPAWFC